MSDINKFLDTLTTHSSQVSDIELGDLIICYLKHKLDTGLNQEQLFSVLSEKDKSFDWLMSEIEKDTDQYAEKIKKYSGDKVKSALFSLIPSGLSFAFSAFSFYFN